MVNNCAACTKTIRASVPNIKCSKCSSYFHQMCVNITDRKLSEDIKSVWICPLCQSKEPRKDNSNTPVRAAASSPSTDEIANVLLREGARKMTTLSSPSVVVTAESDDLSALTTEIKLLRSDIGDMKTHMLSLTEHIKQCFTRIDEHEQKLIDADSRLRQLEDRENEFIMCRNQMVELRHDLNTRAQASLRNEIEIAGVNECPDENPLHLVKVISLKIGAPLDISDLDFVTRVGPRSHVSVGNGGTADRTPRPLVVRFLRRHNRETFLREGKSRRNLTCADVQVDGPARAIYINERLTQENRQLFRAARLRAKSADYKFCWVKSGTVYVRKREGNPAIAIRNLDDLERQVCPPPQSA